MKDTIEMHERPGAAHRMVSGRTFDAGGRFRNFLFVTQDRSTGFIAESCAEVLRAANDFLESPRFTWHLAADLSALRDFAPHELANTVLVLVGGSKEPWQLCEPDAGLLKSRLRIVGHLCVVGAGIFLPLSAGLLNGRQVSVHPNFRDAVWEISRELAISTDAITHEHHLSSATGHVAAASMIVNIVGLNAGAIVEQSLEAHLGSHPVCPNSGSLEHRKLLHNAQGNSVIADALEIMSANLEDTLSIREVADQIPTSARHLERCCRELLGMSPIQVYRYLQLGRAQQLLTQTDISITEVSVATGFNSTSKMAKWYRRKYGELPNHARKLALYGRGSSEEDIGCGKLACSP